MTSLVQGGSRKDRYVKFQALKKVNGKQISQTFDTVRQAQNLKTNIAATDISDFVHLLISFQLTTFCGPPCPPGCALVNCEIKVIKVF